MADSIPFLRSPRHPRVQETVALHHKQQRDAAGLIVVEGPHPVEEALKAGLQPVYLFLLETWQAPHNHLADFTGIEQATQHAESYWVSDPVMRKLGTTASALPIVGVFRHPAANTAPSSAACSLSLAPDDRVLVLDSLQDPGNLGTLLRSAAAFGVRQILLTGTGVDPYHPKVIRATAGLLFRLAITHTPEPLLGVLQTLHQQGAALMLTSGAREQGPEGAPEEAEILPCPLPYQQAHWHPAQPVVLVLGSEGPGLPQSLMRTVAQWERVQCVTIPMAPGVDSLNVAVSGSILLAHAALIPFPVWHSVDEEQGARSAESGT